MGVLKLATFCELDAYKCSVCGTLVQILDPRGMELVCCGRPMAREAECAAVRQRSVHRIEVEKMPGGLRVRIGRPLHPMTPEHRILWIEAITGGMEVRRFLRPGNPPEATFRIAAEGLCVRAYCSRHGLWRSPESRPASIW